LDYTAILILACVFIPLERLLPLHPEQRTLRRGWLNDVFYLIFNGFVVRIGLTALVGAVMYAYREVVPVESTAWVGALPIWVQVIAVIVIADIGYYTAHRLSHAIPFLWKFHAVHHSIEEMDWLASHRVHPVDQILSTAISLLPVFFLDFSFAAVAIYQLVYYVQALLVHSNVKINFGPLKWLIASPEYHHWHHADQREAYDRNFAAQLSIIDVIAGTMFLPKHRPEKYGLTEEMPQHYHTQFIHPFKGIAKSILKRTSQSRPHTPKVRPHEQDA
jgi:sterol desaturase/sphingolipid hydroxylase (fatty acid hydroxylase superfamily)